MFEPFYFDLLNQHDSYQKPGTIQASNSKLSAYYRRYLAQKAYSIYDWQGVPDTWDMAYFKYSLMIYGSVCVLKTDRFGVIPQTCGYGGYNVFYRPTLATISNPLFDRTYQLKIGTQCELIRLSPDWMGISDLIGHYADLMALVVSAIACNLVNSKLSYVFTAESDSMAASFKKLFDLIGNGNPAVFADKHLFNDEGNPRWTSFQQDLKSTYIVDLLQAAEQALLADFYTQIGIPSVGYEKKERLLTDEISANNYATECLADLWLRTMRETSEKVNAMFGLSLSVDFTEALKRQMEAQPADGDEDPEEGGGMDG